MTNVRTDAGLIVPESAIQKTQRVLPRDTVKHFGQFIRRMRGEGIQVLLGCAHCKQPLDLAIADRLDDTQRGGRPVFTCTCSERVVR